MDCVKKIFLFCITASIVAMLCTLCERQGKELCLKESESTPVLMRLYKYVIGDDMACDSWIKNFQIGAVQFQYSDYMDIECMISVLLFALSFKMLTKTRPRLMMEKRPIALQTSSKSKKQKRLISKCPEPKYPESSIFTNQLRKVLRTLEIDRFGTDMAKRQEPSASDAVEILQVAEVKSQPTERLS